MAKTDTVTDDFADIELDVYTPATIEGVYDRHVRAALAGDAKLAETDPEAYEAGKRTRVSILAPTGEPNDEGAYPSVDKEIRFFQDSARLHDRTARKLDHVPQGDGYTKVSFILIPKQTRPRKKNAEGETTGDTDLGPEDEALEATDE